MIWLKNNWFKVFLPIAILAGCAILGGFFYVTQLKKQESIERQQQAKLMEDRRIEDAKAEQTNKEYVAKRKTDCLDIYKTESGKWNNVRGWRYNETTDECLIRYKESSPKSDAECDKLYPTGKDTPLSFFMDNLLCKDGEFENSF